MQKNSKFMLDMLSPRQKEIFLLKKENYSNGEIANKLGLKRGTVQSHLDRIEKKCMTYSEQIQKNYDIIKTKRKIK